MFTNIENDQQTLLIGTSGFYAFQQRYLDIQYLYFKERSKILLQEIQSHADLFFTP